MSHCDGEALIARIDAFAGFKGEFLLDSSLTLAIQALVIAIAGPSAGRECGV
jgi:hypothetical protein